MWNPKNYRLHLDHWGLWLFIMIMMPNLICMGIPAPQDIFRRESITPVLDVIVSIVQVFLLTFLCFFVNRRGQSAVEQKSMLGICFSITIYLFGWVFYYIGFHGSILILILSLSPCAAFLFYAWSRQNGPAFTVTIVFAVLHTIQGVLNYT